MTDIIMSNLLVLISNDSQNLCKQKDHDHIEKHENFQIRNNSVQHGYNVADWIE